MNLTFYRYLNEFKQLKPKETIIYLIAAAVFYYPILNASVYFADDLYRALAGTFGWYHLGRPIADITALTFSSVIDFRKPSNVDPFPLSWFISVFFISISGLLVYLKLKRVHAQSSYILGMIFILNPFFIHNLLYRFDSVGMFLSLSFASLAFYLGDSRKELIIKFALLILVLLSYQTFFNVFIGLLALTLLISAIPSKNNCHNQHTRSVIINLSISILSASTYLLLSKSLLPNQGARRSTLMEISVDLPINLLENYLQAVNTFIEFWSYFLPYIFIPLVLAILGIIKLALKKQKLVVLATAFFLLFISSIGYMAILKNQFVLPRGLPYFSIYMMAMFVLLVYVNRHLQWLFVLPIFACFIFVSRVGSAHIAQSNFENPVLSQTASRLNQISGISTIFSINGMPMSPLSSNIINRTPFQAFLSRTGYRTAGRLITMGAHNVKFQWSGDYNRTKQRFQKDIQPNYDPVFQEDFYDIYVKENTAWVYWKTEKKVNLQ